MSAPGASVDLHCHSTRSDGKLSPTAVVELAAEWGVTVLALTDHDTMLGLPEAQAAALRLGLVLLPGMEISADHGGTNLHVLAWFPPGAPPELSAWQEERRRAREVRARAMLDKLRQLGCELSEEDVFTPELQGVPGRPHLARALLRRGYVESEQEAFQRYLGRDRPGYVSTPLPTAAEAATLVRALGGLSAVAHPGVDRLDPLLPELAEAGINGVEAYHPSHDPEQATHFERRAAELGLLVTGGSDFHGRPAGDLPPQRPLMGHVPLPAAAWERFAATLLETAQESPA